MFIFHCYFQTLFSRACQEERQWTMCFFHFECVQTQNLHHYYIIVYKHHYINTWGKRHNKAIVLDQNDTQNISFFLFHQLENNIVLLVKKSQEKKIHRIPLKNLLFILNIFVTLRTIWNKCVKLSKFYLQQQQNNQQHGSLW